MQENPVFQFGGRQKEWTKVNMVVSLMCVGKE